MTRKTTRPTHTAARTAADAISLEQLEPRRLLAATPSITGGGTGPTSLAPVQVTYDRAHLGQTWEGAGASMQTWKFRGVYDDPKFYNDLVGDAGVNIVRVALWQGFENKNDDNNPDSTDLSGFNSAALGPSLKFAQQFTKRSPDIKVLASVWTPPFWMKTNAAHTNGGTLRADMYDEFAEYCSAYVKIAQRDYGVKIDVLSLQNEPFFIEWYESALYTPGQMVRLMKTVQDRFDRDGITTRLSVSEDLNINDRFKWWSDTLLADPKVAGSDFIFGSHWIPTATVPEVGAIVKNSGHPLWLTESGGANTNDWSAAMHYADTITDLMNKGELSAFLDWQFEGDGHSSLYAADKKAPRYYAAKHFAHWVRPGARRAEITTTNTDFNNDGYKDALATGWYDPARGAETVVLTNKGTVDAQYHVTGLEGSWQAWKSDAAVQFAGATVTPDAAVNGVVRGLTVTVPARGMLTLYNGTSDPVNFTPSDTGRGSPPYVNAPDAAESSSLQQSAYLADIYGVGRELNKANNANVNERAPGGRTPLAMAAASNSDDVVATFQLLVGRGATVEARDDGGLTPLMVAASNPFVQYAFNQNLAVQKVQALVNLGGSLTSKDLKGLTALHWAATATQFSFDAGQGQNANVVSYLLSAGADKNKVDKTGRRPADWAALQGNTANLAALNAWTSDTKAPQVLDSQFTLDRGVRFGVDFDEALLGLPASGPLFGGVRVVLLTATNNVARTVGSKAAVSAKAAGNTHVDVKVSPRDLPDGWFRVEQDPATAAANGGFRDAAGNLVTGPIGGFWFLNGDANRDKVVDAQDAAIVQANFGRRNTGFSGGDLNFDGRVDVADYNLLRRQMGKVLPREPFGGTDIPNGGGNAGPAAGAGGLVALRFPPVKRVGAAASNVGSHLLNQIASLNGPAVSVAGDDTVADPLLRELR